jgi:L-alanine-DL-glutamate epimerase-like enolase superfamily enzyme
MKVEVVEEHWPLVEPFRTSNAVYPTTDVLRVSITDDEGRVGRGETCGVDYHGETLATMAEQILAVDPDLLLEDGHQRLLNLLPPGGARNGLDCALWDWRAKRTGQRIWDLTGTTPTRPLETFISLGMDAPAIMAQRAQQMPVPQRIKLKLGDAQDFERLRAVRSAAPDATLIVDANQAWSLQDLQQRMPELLAARVSLIEQPLPVGQEQCLRGFASPIPLCADESCQDRASLGKIVGCFDFVNIKLDKAGGLTEALALASAASVAGLQLMVGCMSATSLGIAPAWLVGQRCKVVDLDWHLLNRDDYPVGFSSGSSTLHAFKAELWG